MTIPIDNSDSDKSVFRCSISFLIIEFTVIYQKKDKTKFTANNTVNYIYFASTYIIYITRLGLLTKKILYLSAKCFFTSFSSLIFDFLSCAVISWVALGDRLESILTKLRKYQYLLRNNKSGCRSLLTEMPIDVQCVNLELKTALSLHRIGFHWSIMVCSVIAFHNHKFF